MTFLKLGDSLIDVLIKLIIIFVFWLKTRNPKVSSTPGRKCILIGFLFLIIGDLSEIFEELEPITINSHYLRNVRLLLSLQFIIGHSGGFIFIVIGILKCLPSLIREQKLKARLEDTNKKLEHIIQRHELALSIGPAWSWEIDVKNSTIEVDNQLYTALGYSKEEFSTLDDHLNVILYPRKKKIYDLIKEAAEGKREGFDIKLLLKSKNGKNMWVKSKNKMIVDDEGRPERIIGISWDITDLMETQSRLEEESALNKTLSQLAEQIISTNSLSEVSELCLEAALHFTQSPYGLAGEVDPPTNDLVYPCFSKDVLKDCKLPRGKLIFSDSELFALVVKKGEPVLVNAPEEESRFSGVPLGHVSINRFLLVPAVKNNIVIGLLGVANAPFDYTDNHLKIMEQIAKLYALGIERILKENNLYKALIAAEDAAQVKYNFVISISHELRTPLNAILGFGQLLESQQDQLSKEEMVKYISYILEAGGNLASMIEDMLAVACPDNLNTSSMMHLCSLGHLINEFKQMAVSMASQKQIYLEIKSDPNINNLQIRTDPSLLKIAFRHLLDNAIKFTPEGGKIFVSFSTTDTDFIISVKDTGIGIDPKDHQIIFEDFVQLKSGLKDKTPGLGLGLALVKRIANILEGKIEVQSEGEGKGSEFILKIPLAQKNKMRSKMIKCYC